MFYRRLNDKASEAAAYLMIKNQGRRLKNPPHQVDPGEILLGISGDDYIALMGFKPAQFMMENAKLFTGFLVVPGDRLVKAQEVLRAFVGPFQSGEEQAEETQAA